MAFTKIMCFGNGSSNKEDPVALKKNRDIEKQIREDQRKMSREVKLLLLGACARMYIYEKMLTCARCG